MKLSQVIEVLGAEVLLDGDHENIDLSMACGCDLMSDVLTFIKAHQLLSQLSCPQV